MQRSTDRVLTTHVGSLARPEALLDTMREKEHGRPYDADLFPNVLIATISQRQHSVTVWHVNLTSPHHARALRIWPVTM